MVTKPNLLTAVAIAIIVLLGPGISEAHAYIDPGTGSSLLTSLGMVFGVIAACAAIVFTQIKRWGHWFVARFSKAPSVPKTDHK